MWLAMQHGSAKEARFFAGAGHMGEPFATPFIFNWIFNLFGCERTADDVKRATSTIITPIKFKL